MKRGQQTTNHFTIQEGQSMNDCFYCMHKLSFFKSKHKTTHNSWLTVNYVDETHFGLIAAYSCCVVLMGQF